MCLRKSLKMALCAEFITTTSEPFYVSGITDRPHHRVVSITFNKLSRILRPVHTSALQTRLVQ